jgi:protoporphyrin/coproporphyrin ferrochelatase
MKNGRTNNTIRIFLRIQFQNAGRSLSPMNGNGRKKKIGVVLMNLGGPTSEDNIRYFLYNLFSDQDIIRLGGGTLQNLLAKTISKFRSPRVAVNYKAINGCPKGCLGSKYCLNRQNKVISDCCSPINSLTELQRRSLEKKMRAQLPGYDIKVYTAMRYWLPFASDIMEEMIGDGIEEAVLMPLYPHFSWTTSGSSFRDWENTRLKFKALGKEISWNEYVIKSYHLNPDYLNAVNERIDQTMKRFSKADRSKVHIVFTAHGTPIVEVESGDPYTRQINETVEAIMELRGRKEDYWVSFQSRVGPQKWTQPNTEKLVLRLVDYGVQYLLMVPIAFVTDHIETLMELDIELREAIEEKGKHIRQLEVMPGLNDHPLFMQAVAQEIYFRTEHFTGIPENAAVNRVEETLSSADE